MRARRYRQTYHPAKTVELLWTEQRWSLALLSLIAFVGGIVFAAAVVGLIVLAP